MALAAMLLAGLPVQAIAQTMVAVSNGRVVGKLNAVAGADGRIAIDYLVRDNGRGPSAKETLTLDRDGLPTAWEIEGVSIVGAPARETMRRSGGKIDWVSDADRGSLSGPTLYLANLASPYALGIYARAALRSPGHRIPVAPGGELRVEDLAPAPAAVLAAYPGARIYRLSGLWMEPRYVVLSADRELLATTGEGNLVKAGLEAAAPDIQKQFRALQVARIGELQRRLAHRFDGPVHIRNVHVFDPRSRTLGPLQIVTVFRDRIASVLPDDAANRAATDGDVVIDGAGGTLIPGLRDMHSHTSLESGLFNLAAGVTSTRDMGNSPDFLLDLMPRLDRGEMPGPRVTPAGYIEGKSPYSASTGILASSLDEALAAVRWYGDRNYRQIKIYNSITPAWVKPMAAEAHRIGMGVVGHVPAFMTGDEAIRDGYDEVAHINQLMFQWVLKPGEDTRTTLRIVGLNRFADIDLAGARVAETLRLMREHRTVLDTTVSTQERLALSRAGRAHRGELAYLDHVPIAYQRYRRRDFVPTKGRAEEAKYEQATDTMVALVGRLHAQGTRLMPGTDDPYGFPLHRELELYVMAGISPAETLAIDVLGTADYMGQTENLGTIERGKLADMVLLPGDPTRDIAEVRRGRMVMRGGTIYYPDEIYTALSIRPFSTRPSITVPAATAAASAKGMR